MNINDISVHLDEFDKQFEYLKDDYEDFDDEIVEIATMSAAEYQNFLSRRAVTEYGQVFKSFHAFVVSNLLDIYTRSTNQERQQILEEVAHRPFALNALWSLLEEYRWRLQKSTPREHPQIFRTLLLLAVLSEEYLDQPETAMILTSAWREAEFAGLNPKQFFVEVAALAGQQEVIHGRSPSKYLANFEPYDYGSP